MRKLGKIGWKKRIVEFLNRRDKGIEYRRRKILVSPFPSPRVYSTRTVPSTSPSSTDRYHFETVGEQRLELEADSVPPALRFNACGPISLINKVNSALGSL